MAFPSSIDSFTGFTSSHTLAQDQHAAQHNQEQAAIVALENKLGTGSSTPSNATVLRGNGTGSSIWAQLALATDVSGILAQANGGNGTDQITGMGAAVFQNNPSLSNPVITGGGSWAGSPSLSSPNISDFSNAQHNHQNNAGGGPLDGSKALINSSITPAKLALHVKIGTIPAASFGSTGNISVTGIGFKPQFVKFECLNGASTGGFNIGHGAMDSLGNQYVVVYTNSPARNSSTSACIGYLSGGSTTFVLFASYVSMDSDGFTIDVTSIGSAFVVAYEAWG